MLVNYGKIYMKPLWRPTLQNLSGTTQSLISSSTTDTCSFEDTNIILDRERNNLQYSTEGTWLSNFPAAISPWNTQWSVFKDKSGLDRAIWNWLPDYFFSVKRNDRLRHNVLLGNNDWTWLPTAGCSNGSIRVSQELFYNTLPALISALISQEEHEKQFDYFRHPASPFQWYAGAVLGDF